jgi:hypothetical protein
MLGAHSMTVILYSARFDSSHLTREEMKLKQIGFRILTVLFYCIFRDIIFFVFEIVIIRINQRLLY